MNPPRTLLGDERGIAFVLALIALLSLTGLVLAVLSMSAFEPQISQNLTDTTRARHIAEAGIEFAYNTLVAATQTTTFTPFLAGATCSTGAILAGANAVPLPGLTATNGTFTARVRNDCLAAPSDQSMTGVALDASATTDSNGVVIVTSTGTINNATRTIQVVIRRIPFPPFPGAVNLAGVQSDTFVNTTTFAIDGRDYTCAANCTNNASWSLSNVTANLKYGMQVQPGIQTNINKTYELNAQAAFNSTAHNAVFGKSQHTGAPATGLSTIAPDSTLNPTVLATFLSQVAAYSGTTILQSTMTCPMVLTGSAIPSKPTLTNGCGTNQALNLGTSASPKLVYFRGQLDTTSAFTGLTANGTIQGAGILIIEDGDFKNLGNFRWDGIVMVVGRYIGNGFMSGSTTNIYGAFVSGEAIANEPVGFYEFLIASGVTEANFRASKQNIDMAQFMRSMTNISSWREL
jgi:Tfp pilus assembly protein PilX